MSVVSPAFVAKVRLGTSFAFIVTLPLPSLGEILIPVPVKQFVLQYHLN